MSVASILKTMEYGPAPESAATALQWIERHGGQFGLYIGGEWQAPRPDHMFDCINPATARPLAKISQATGEDVDAAVRAAREAFPSWSALPGHTRARYLYALARHIQKRARLLSVLESLDNGKPIRETRDLDIPLVARHFYHHAGWAQLMESELEGHEPLGVVGQIIPWNFPLLMLSWKIAPALAMGNTVVLKPAEYTSITAIAFAEICQEVGLPPGVVNIVTGDGRVGEKIVRHPDIDKIAFTGSTEVGRLIRKQTAGTGKRLSLELGGKSPFIVFDDADLDSAVEGVVDAIWFNQGEVCCAGSRLLVQESIAEPFLASLRARMETLRVGDPLDKAVDIGAIVAKVQLEQIGRLVAQGQEEGGTMWQPSGACPADGYFFPPTLFTDVSPSSTLDQVEIFGPVLISMSFRTPAEAVELANNTRYGLAASVWSENLNLALDVARRVKAGAVWVNSTNLLDAAAGFGGYRESGYGREGGKEGLWEYVKRSRSERPLHRSNEGTPDTRAADGNAADRSLDDGGMARDGAPDGSPLGLVLAGDDLPAIDRTPKMYIGGKQSRPDAPYPRPVVSPDGRRLGEVGEGNRKDIRNAVEAAHKAGGWAGSTAHLRAQVLYYVGENLSARAAEFAARLSTMTSESEEHSAAEVSRSIERLFTYAAWADKYDGAVHHTPLRNVTLAMPEPIGVIGVICPEERPLLALVSLIAPAIAMGNTVVVVPSETYPLAAVDLYQVLDTSDVPGGVVNIVTGARDSLAKVLAEHDDVGSIWYFGTDTGRAMVEAASVGNMKRTWAHAGQQDWMESDRHEVREALREATHVKNIWVPYGE